jgi:hypothetical protein
VSHERFESLEEFPIPKQQQPLIVQCSLRQVEALGFAPYSARASDGERGRDRRCGRDTRQRRQLQALDGDFEIANAPLNVAAFSPYGEIELRSVGQLRPVKVQDAGVLQPAQDGIEQRAGTRNSHPDHLDDHV